MRRTATFLICLAIATAILSGSAGADAVKVDPAIQKYRTAGKVSGNLSSIGSDTLNNLMTLWAEGFGRRHLEVKIQIEGKGSSTAPPALIAGTAQLGPMSRAMKSSEIDEFEKKYGYKPTAIRVALDGLAVYVNKDNPLDRLTLLQVDAIFSKSRKGGHSTDIAVWGDLGLTSTWLAKPISVYGRNSASGTYGYFKEHALFKGDYKDTVKEQPGSASVVQGVTEDMFGIGYSGIGYRTAGVKAIRIAEKDGADFFEPTYESVLKGEYPLARFLYVYVNRTPGKPLDPLVREFLKYVHSADGQEVVLKDGYLPLTGKVVEEERARIE